MTLPCARTTETDAVPVADPLAAAQNSGLDMLRWIANIQQAGADTIQMPCIPPEPPAPQRVIQYEFSSDLHPGTDAVLSVRNGRSVLTIRPDLSRARRRMAVKAVLEGTGIPPAAVLSPPPSARHRAPPRRGRRPAHLSAIPEGGNLA